MPRQMRINFTTDEEKAGSVIADLIERRVSNMEFSVLTDDGQAKSSIAISVSDTPGLVQRSKSTPELSTLRTR